MGVFQARRTTRTPWIAAATTALMAIGLIAVPGTAAMAAPGDFAYGTVIVDSNKNGVIDDTGIAGTDDSPVAGVKVTLKGSNPDVPGVEKSTAADGTWAFSPSDATTAGPAPYTVTVDAAGVNGNAYIVPESQVPGVNDFAEVVGQPQQSVSASIPAGTTELQLNAIVIPTWSTDVIVIADPDGMGGNSIYTGAGGPGNFDPNDNEPGFDSGKSNSRIRTGDVIDFNWSITGNQETDPDPGVDTNYNAWFEQTIQLAPGAVATFGKMDECLPGSTITALPSGATLMPRQDPPAGTTSVVLSCNLGLMGDVLGQKTLPTQIFVSSNSENGATFTTSVRTWGQDANGVTTARPDGPSEFGPFEITAAPRYDIEKQRPWVWSLSQKDVNGVSRFGWEISYSIQISTDRKVGVEAAQQPITFEDSMWALTNDGTATLRSDFPWEITSCVPDVGSTSVGPGATTVYGKIGGPLTDGKPASDATNSVRDSGTCSFTRVGDPETGNYEFSLDGIDMSGASFPTKSKDGATLPANKFYVAAYAIKVFVPYEAVDAMDGIPGNATGSVRLGNRVGDFDPTGKSGASNFGSGFEPGYCAAGPNADRATNCAAMPGGGRSNNVAPTEAELIISPGSWGKTLSHPVGTWFFRNKPVPESANTNGDGNGQVQPGQTFSSTINAKFSLESPGIEVCDVFDNTTMKLDLLRNIQENVSTEEAWNSAYAAVVGTFPGQGEIDRSKMAAFQANWEVRYAHVDLTGDTANNGTFDAATNRYKGDWTKQQTAASGSNMVCGNSAVNWVSSPDQVVGGIDEVNAVWFRAKDGYVQPSSTQLWFISGLQQRDTFHGGPNDGKPIPELTVAANFANLKSTTFGNWTAKNPFVPGAGTTEGKVWADRKASNMGDRWTVVRARMAITKETIAGVVDGQPATGAASVGTNGSAVAGTPVIWQINPSLTAVASPAAPVHNVTVTDTLPSGAIYDPDATAALVGNTAPTSYTVNANGTTTLVWQLGTRVPNAPIGPFKVVTHADALLAPNTALKNVTQIKADGVVPASVHTDDHTVTVSQPGSLQLKKSVDQVLDLQDGNQQYTLQMRNFSQTLRYQNPTIIEVLPYNGDTTNAAGVKRVPGSDFAGTSRLNAAPTATQFDGKTAAPGTFYYTTISPANVPQNLNDDTDPTIWSMSYTPDATAFKFVADAPLGNVNEGALAGIVIKFQTNQSGNAAGDLYSNRFTAFASNLQQGGKMQLLTSNQVMVRVVGFSVGDLIWFDNDNDGKFTAGVDTTAPLGTKVEVYDKDGKLVPGGNVTTNKDGRWVVNDLPQGDYYAVIPASEFATGGKLEGYVVQTVGYEADPNNDKNEGVDNNGAAQADGSVKTGNLHVSATVNGSVITGDEPLNDNTGNMPVTPLTTDGFTNFTLDIALKPVPKYEFTKVSDPVSGTAVDNGKTITYVLEGKNTGKTPLTVEITDDLTEVLKYATVTTEPTSTMGPVPTWNGNDVRWTGSLKPGESVKVTYTVTVGEGHAGKIIKNHAVSTATPPYDPPLPPIEGETHHPIPGFTFTKEADPASKTAVQPGDEITYTLRGTNTGATVLDPVTITDDLSKVLNNATIDLDSITATIAGVGMVPDAELTGTTLSWTGRLPVGREVVITYTVKVNEGAWGVLLENLATGEATPPGLPPIETPPVTTEHPTPKYEFTKVSDPASGTPVAPGVDADGNPTGEITYTLTGINSGKTVLDPVVITDDLSNVLNNATVTVEPVATIAGVDEADVPQPTRDGNDVAWTGVLQPGQSVVITYTVTLNDDAWGVVVNNHAESTATPPTGPPIEPPFVETNHPTPKYEFAKTSNPASGNVVNPEGSITYTLTGSNTGETKLDPVVITDDLSQVLNNATMTVDPAATIDGVTTGVPQPTLDGTEVSWTGVLEKGQTVQITYTVTLNEGTDKDAVVVNNHAESSATPPGLPPITPPPGETEHPVPGYTFTKDSDPVSSTPVMPGGTITYTLTGTNTGATVLDPVVISDDLSKVLNHATVTAEPVATINDAPATAPTRDGDEVSWTGALQPGETVKITYTVKLNDDATGVIVQNKAISSAQPVTPPGQEVPPISPPPGETWHPTPGYTFNKAANPPSGTTVKAGDDITYTLAGTNAGETVLESVVTDDLTNVLAFADLTAGPTWTIVDADQNVVDTGDLELDGTALKWEGTLQKGEQILITYTVKVKAGFEGKTLKNSAASSWNPPGEPPVEEPPVVTEHPIPGYTFTKASDPKSGTPVSPEGTITYTLTGVNTGATDLDPVVITDDLANVLNNATLVGEPKATIEGADNVPAVEQDGTTLTWTGSLKKGQTVTITYTVKLNKGTEGVIVKNSASSTATPPPGVPPIEVPPIVTEHPVPGYTFDKTSDPVSGSAVQPGGTITYTLTGSNIGATVLDPVVITDDLSKVLNNATMVGDAVVTIAGVDAPPAATLTGTTLSWTGVLQAGQIVKITYTVKLNEGTEGQVLNNSASSTATPPPGVPPIEVPPIVTEHPVPGYTFTKSSDPKSGTTVLPEGEITYTLTGVNTGATVLDPVVITDDLSNVLNNATMVGEPKATIEGADDVPAATLTGTTLSWTGVLEAGQTVKITYTVKLNKDTAGVIVNNHAESTATPPTGPEITPPPVETEHPVPGYTFDKTSDPVSGSAVQPGGTITYTLTGVNTGATVLDPVVITDDLSNVLNNATLTAEPVVTIEGVDAPPAAKLDGTTLSWTGVLQPGQTVAITYTVTLNADTAGVIVNNHAESTATPPTGPEITPPPVETEHPVPGYTFTKESNPVSGTPVAPGGTITYTLTGANTGATVLDPVQITDDLSKVLNNAKMTIEPVATIAGAAAPAPTMDGTTLSWTGVLQPGQTVVITYTVTLNEGTAGVIVNNHASSTATPPTGPEITPPPVETEHPVPGYTFDKSSDPESGTAVTPGDEITYTLTGTNTGATVLDPVVINDDLSKVLNHATIVTDAVATIEGVDSVPAPVLDGTKLSWTGVLQPGQSVVITYTVKLNDDATGVIINNHASSTATPPGEVPPINPPDEETWHPTPGYTFNKVADPASGNAVEAGDVISYTLTGTNAGETVLDPVTITDDLAKVLAFASIENAPAAVIVAADGSESPANAPVLDGTTLTWTGSLQIGEQVKVTYSVKVKAGFEGETINNHAESSATPPGKPPVTPPPVVTEHPIPGYTFAKSADPKSGTTVLPGQKITYTLTGVNTGSTVLDPVIINDDLSKVLDHAKLTGEPVVKITGADNAPAATIDGTALTWTGSLQPGQTVTITYTVTVNADAAGATLRNHATSSATPPGLPPIVPPPGETEHPVPGYTITKTSDPASGTKVKAGQKITYTIVGSNTGATVLNSVTINDDLSQVLNNTTMVGEPKAEIISSDGTVTPASAPKLEGMKLTWNGSLQIGEQVRIVYTVKINDGVHGVKIVNTVTSTALPPEVPPITPPPGETEHPVPPIPGKPLPSTGQTLPTIALGLALMLLIGGAGVLVIRRRQEKTEH